MLKNILSSLVMSAYPFKKKGRKSLAKKLAKCGAEKTLFSGHLGINFVINPSNYIDQHTFRSGLYEKELVMHFCDLAEKYGATHFLDIGSNVGVYSLTFRKRMPNAEIHAFEPDPLNFTQLASNVFLNDFYDGIHLHQKGVSDKSEEVTFYLQRDPNHLSTGQSGLVKEEGVVYQEHQIQVTSLDDAFDFSGKKIAMKIDIEGHEANCIAGMKKLAKENDILMQVEVWPENLTEIRGQMKEYGFTELPQLSEDHHDYYFVNF